MLHLHRSERADALVDALAGVLASPLPDPLETELVAVPSRGVERWLAQRLSASLGASGASSGWGAASGSGPAVILADGVCANVAFPFPERLLSAALAAAEAHLAGSQHPAPHAATGRGDVDTTDPWSPGCSVWALLEVAAEHAGEPWCELLTAHLGRAGGTQRYAALRHVADLFDRYAVHRPAMLRSWAAGDDVDAAGAPLEPDVAWQARLWRLLRERVGRPSRAELLEPACEAIRSEPIDLGLPERISLFGLTRLAPSYLEVLRAVSLRCEVHLFLLHPSPALWAEVTASAQAGVLPRRAEDPSAALAVNPLLASWGRDAREMQLVLEGGRAAAFARHHPAPEPSPLSLLGRLQCDVRANRRPPGAPLPGEPDLRLALDPGDCSLQVHDCHGRGRQAEVVRDAILHLLADDPTLEPRDVIVMCPDIERWAPLVRAAFDAGMPDDAGAAGAGGAAGPPAGGAGEARIDLRARLADRSLRQTNELFSVVSVLLSMAGSRVSASQVLDLASMPPVRRRFGFDDGELARLRGWVADAGVRWGLDGEHRRPYGLDGLGENSWQHGLDRLLLGVALAEDGVPLLGGVLPLEDAGSADVELAGRLAELVERLRTTLDQLAPPSGPEAPAPVRPLAGFLDAVTAGLDALALAADGDRWQRLQVDRLLAEVREQAGERATTVPVELEELRSLLADRLRGRPTRANFRTGQLTICTLVPMRSVPHRVVCLLGLDDGAFPRAGHDDGDDLVGIDPWVGDRDARSEDRQLLLDALLAAGEHLVVTYRGRDERTNAARPPAVPVGELLDVVDATATASAGQASEQVVVRHPLQPFDPRAFRPGELVPGVAWSFDRHELAGARALAGPRTARRPFLAAPLEPLDQPVVELAELARVLANPVAAFVARRLGVRPDRQGEDADDDRLPIDLEPLARYGVGQRLLEARLTGLDDDAAAAAERARGSLPPGPLADQALAGPLGDVDALWASWLERADQAAEERTVDVAVELDGDTVLSGSVGGVRGGSLCRVGYARLTPLRRLAALVDLLGLAAAGEGAAAPGAAVCRSVSIGRNDTGGGRTRVCISTLTLTGAGAGARAGTGAGAGAGAGTGSGADSGALRAAARATLARLVALYRLALTEPLPLAERSSEAWARAWAEAQGDRRLAAERAARNHWSSGDGDVSREDRKPEHQLVFGPGCPFEELLAIDARAGDVALPGWPGAEVSRFAGLSRLVWGELLVREELAWR